MNKVTTQLIKASELGDFVGFLVFWHIGNNDFEFFQIAKVEILQSGTVKVHTRPDSLTLSREYDPDKEVLVYSASPIR